MDKNAEKRLNITISFGDDKEIYWHVKNQPNSSYYIRKLVKENMNKEVNNSSNKNSIDEFEIKEITKDMLDW